MVVVVFYFGYGFGGHVVVVFDFVYRFGGYGGGSLVAVVVVCCLILFVGLIWICFFQNNTHFQTISLVSIISKLFKKLTSRVL